MATTDAICADPWHCGLPSSDQGRLSKTNPTHDGPPMRVSRSGSLRATTPHYGGVDRRRQLIVTRPVSTKYEVLGSGTAWELATSPGTLGYSSCQVGIKDGFVR